MFEDFFMSNPVEEGEFMPIISVEEDDAPANGEKIPEVLPVLPLKNTVLFPGIVIPITVGREKSMREIRLDRGIAAFVRDIKPTIRLKYVLGQQNLAAGARLLDKRHIARRHFRGKSHVAATANEAKGRAKNRYHQFELHQ